MRRIRSGCGNGCCRRCEMRYRGESVTLLYRGKPKARIVPIGQELGAKLAEAEVFGMWKDRKDLRTVPGYVRKLRQGRLG
jgi:antitoxin (DNA-binding transcriptional repressor) of toxin-antitoxin stability system